VTGLTPSSNENPNEFSIAESMGFNRSFKKLLKTYKIKSVQNQLKELVLQQLLELKTDSYPLNSRYEPLPGKVKLPEGTNFCKIEIRFGKGASGQIRLMYLVNEIDYIITPVYIYSHKQFAKRPSDQELRELLDENLSD